MKELTIRENDAGQRVDKFLTKAFPAMPGSFLYKAIRQKKIKVNRRRCMGNQRLCTGDTLQLFVNEELLRAPREKAYAFLQVPAEVQVVYEDEQVLVVYKPAGLRSQSDTAGAQDCLIARVLHYLYQRHAYDPKAEQSFTPALCNRLDRNTEGLVLVGKTASALRELNQAIRTRAIQKYYLALAKGILHPPQAQLTLYHRKEGTKARIAPKPFSGGTPCALSYRVLRQYEDRALTEIELQSGKFHQIRAVFAHLGHPLWGDVKYGAKPSGEGYQRLCAWRLVFHIRDVQSDLHYLNGKEIALDAAAVMRAWGLETEIE